MKRLLQRPEDALVLDSGTWLYRCDDGSFYLSTGDDYYDVELSREKAEELRMWLTRQLYRGIEP